MGEVGDAGANIASSSADGARSSTECGQAGNEGTAANHISDVTVLDHRTTVPRLRFYRSVHLDPLRERQGGGLKALFSHFARYSNNDLY